MLVLTRREDDEIVMIWGGEIVVVSINKILSRQVKLGIEAPKKIRVFRKELLERIIASNRKWNLQKRPPLMRGKGAK